MDMLAARRTSLSIRRRARHRRPKRANRNCRGGPGGESIKGAGESVGKGSLETSRRRRARHSWRQGRDRQDRRKTCQDGTGGKGGHRQGHREAGGESHPGKGLCDQDFCDEDSGEGCSRKDFSRKDRDSEGHIPSKGSAAIETGDG